MRKILLLSIIAALPALVRADELTVMLYGRPPAELGLPLVPPGLQSHGIHLNLKSAAPEAAALVVYTDKAERTRYRFVLLSKVNPEGEYLNGFLVTCNPEIPCSTELPNAAQVTSVRIYTVSSVGVLTADFACSVSTPKCEERIAAKRREVTGNRMLSQAYLTVCDGWLSDGTCLSADVAVRPDGVLESRQAVRP